MLTRNDIAKALNTAVVEIFIRVLNTKIPFNKNGNLPKLPISSSDELLEHYSSFFLTDYILNTFLLQIGEDSYSVDLYEAMQIIIESSNLEGKLQFINENNLVSMDKINEFYNLYNLLYYGRTMLTEILERTYLSKEKNRQRESLLLCRVLFADLISLKVTRILKDGNEYYTL